MSNGSVRLKPNEAFVDADVTLETSEGGLKQLTIGFYTDDAELAAGLAGFLGTTEYPLEVFHYGSKYKGNYILTGLVVQDGEFSFTFLSNGKQEVTTFWDWLREIWQEVQNDATG